MIRRLYGASLTHAALMLGGAVVVAYAGVRWLQAGAWHISEWFIGSVVGHDLVLLPAYAAADLLLVRALSRHRWLVQYIRVPTLLSALLLAIWWPLILRHDPARRSQTGLSTAPFLGRWLTISAVIFGTAALAACADAIRRARQEDG